MNVVQLSRKRTECLCKWNNTCSPNNEAIAPVSSKAENSRPAMVTGMNGACVSARKVLALHAEGRSKGWVARAFTNDPEARFPASQEAWIRCIPLLCALFHGSGNSALHHGLYSQTEQLRAVVIGSLRYRRIRFCEPHLPHYVGSKSVPVWRFQVEQRRLPAFHA